jgi:8-oxo-dGTP diphosphatase
MLKMSKVSHDSETPADGQQIISAVAAIHHEFNGDLKICMPKRADSKKFFPGVYELPGGHIDFGEDIEAGLKREIVEELGVRINLGDCYSAFTYMNEVKGSHSIEVAYFATLIDPPEEIKLQSKDHSGFRWVSEKELEILEPTTPVELEAALKAFSLLKGNRPKFG